MLPVKLNSPVEIIGQNTESKARDAVWDCYGGFKKFFFSVILRTYLVSSETVGILTKV